VLSANGAPSSLAWGNAPGNCLHNNNKALKARPQRDRRDLQTRIEPRFQRSFHFYRNPGASPQATIENAPLALNRYPFLKGRADPTGRWVIPNRLSAHMCEMMLSPNSEHLISVPPSIRRAKSYVTRLLAIAPFRPFKIKSATSFQPI
jgi:hypothetical protein